MSVTVEGLDGVLAGIDALMQSFTNDVDQIVQEAGQECKDLAFDTAAVDTGEMRDATTYVAGYLESFVTNDSDHVIYIEFGTRKMAAQPFMLPAFDVASENMQDKLKQL